MASNAFGQVFRITTWGESHGPAIGVVIDGCPAGIPLSREEIQWALDRRAPGSAYTSPRKEKDGVEILSGVFEGKSTGAPISLLIRNKDADSSKYESIKDIMRPGHANYTYLKKYGCFDYRGGGRASARETASRVAAGAVAAEFLKTQGIELAAAIVQIGSACASELPEEIQEFRLAVAKSALFCPDKTAEAKMKQAIEKVRQEGDSLGGVVELRTGSLPVGLGDPVYGKLEAKLASAMMSIPASKGFEVGRGFASAAMRGSDHNDAFREGAQGAQQVSNHAGGTLGGISSGPPLQLKVAFKPTSSIMKPQQSAELEGKEVVFQIPAGSRHDPCVAIRAVPVVEAMAALVLADAVLLNRCGRV